MMTVLTLLFVAALLPLLLQVLVLAVQIGAALLPARARSAPPGSRPTIGVLVPAHNEAGGILPTLEAIAAQLAAGERLLVVADNCSDGTAAVARAFGAELVERHDDERRGKGYALDCGVRCLAQAPPEVVVVVDADCIVHQDALALLARRCMREQRPVQALYLMRATPDAAPATRVAQFAWIVKNRLRPLGAARLGLPCQLMGTGMAFPWDVIARAPLASGHIVEDLKLGLDCAAAGQAAVFCAEAVVSSDFPENREGARTQRERWEHGHLDLLLREGLPLLWQAVRTRNAALFWLAVDLGVPPLSLLVLAVMAAASIGAGAWAATATALPWALGTLLGAVLLATLLAAWLAAGRLALPPRQIIHIVHYLLSKLPLYLRFMLRRQRTWISSARDKR
jgi:cellulose synthase/poly-beta-1,6-N-acetylglucosamine synthase-like glycosyltransferase